jgi:hypothetical protein
MGRMILALTIAGALTNATPAYAENILLRCKLEVAPDRPFDLEISESRVLRDGEDQIEIRSEGFHKLDFIDISSKYIRYGSHAGLAETREGKPTTYPEVVTLIDRSSGSYTSKYGKSITGSGSCEIISGQRNKF